MLFNKHSELEGKHAFLSASKSTWLRKDEDGIFTAYAKSYSQMLGTALHDIARKHIKHNVKITKSSKKEILLSLLEDYNIPSFALEVIDVNNMFDNLITYVEDAIGYKMIPEQILFYSPICFGTTDAIAFRDGVLRIHDYKSGTTPAHIEQLYIYAALFCLEYDIKPGTIEFDLRIYQNNEVIYDTPTVEDILPIMDMIIKYDKMLTKVKEQEG